MHLAALLLSFTASTVCKSTFSPARPPAIPLAVRFVKRHYERLSNAHDQHRSPYLNTFQMAGSDGGNGGCVSLRHFLLVASTNVMQDISRANFRPSGREYNQSRHGRLANENSGAITGWTGMIRVDLQNYIWSMLCAAISGQRRLTCRSGSTKHLQSTRHADRLFVHVHS